MHKALIPFPLILPYAETHYKFMLPWSPLFKKWPEIFVDCPRFAVPGTIPPVYLVVKDAEYFPVKICGIEIILQYQGIMEKQKIELNYAPKKQHEFIKLPVKFPQLTGLVTLNAKIICENSKGGINEIFNNNLTGLKPLPLEVYLLETPLPYPFNWAAGETHCHSCYTSNPIEFGASFSATQEAGRALGLKYIVCTDHSWDFNYDNNHYMKPADPEKKWHAYKEEIRQTNEMKTDDLPFLIAGEEISCGNHLGQNVHMLVMGSEKFIPGIGDGGRRWLNNHPDKSIQESLDMAGDVPCYAAHPKMKMGRLERFIFRRGNWFEQDLSPSPTGKTVAGLQFWNGHRKKDFSYGRAFWVQQLLTGKKLLPLAANDSHGDFNMHTGVTLPLIKLYQSMNHVFGMVRTLVNSPVQNTGEVQKGLSSGDQVCTDGPFLTINLQDGNLRVEAKSIPFFGALSRIHVFSGNKGDQRETVVKSWEFKGETYEINEHVPVPGSIIYVRAEAWTQKDKLAICSPVWV